ncbi:hypothetical protein SLE2022_264760 [Rubroshorea leprosula]
MEVECISSLRMAAALFCLLLFVQLPVIFATGFEVQSTICGADHISYSNSYGFELFYLNGNLVDKDVFCKALQFHHANNCPLKGNLEGDSCKLGLSSAEFAFSPARRLLLKEGRGDNSGNDSAQASNTSGKNNGRHFMSTPTIVGMAAIGLIMSCVIICPCFYKRRRATAHTVLAKEPNSIDSTSSWEMSSVSEKVQAQASPLRIPPSPSRFSISPQLSRLGSVHLNMNQVVKATRNFSSSLLIGEGGFGTVYKAQLESGQLVAIKRAKKEHFENLQTEFSSEVELLAKIDHRNLVKLLGYIDQGDERLIITEYVPNGTLREHLDGQRGRILDFNQRLEIAIDVAHGLTYLHIYAEKQIIHRDVKSSNILLTDSMRAKVADFGFARLGPVDAERTHISTKVKGTVGYLDPEYMKTYQLTPKSDVYSFGILLIEILTGRRPVELKRNPEERVTIRWVFEKCDEGRLMEVVDPLMEEVVNVEILRKLFDLAFQCAGPVRNDRPDMKLVAEELWAIRADYLKSKERGA